MLIRVDVLFWRYFWIIAGLWAGEGKGLLPDGIIFHFMRIIEILWYFLRVHRVNKNKIMILPPSSGISAINYTLLYLVNI